MFHWARSLICEGNSVWRRFCFIEAKSAAGVRISTKKLHKTHTEAHQNKRKTQRNFPTHSDNPVCSLPRERHRKNVKNVSKRNIEIWLVETSPERNVIGWYAYNYNQLEILKSVLKPCGQVRAQKRRSLVMTSDVGRVCVCEGTWITYALVPVVVVVVVKGL